jgi:hypothetical protein
MGAAHLGSVGNSRGYGESTAPFQEFGTTISARSQFSETFTLSEN